MCSTLIFLTPIIKILTCSVLTILRLNWYQRFAFLFVINDFINIINCPCNIINRVANKHSFIREEKKNKLVINCSCCQRTTSKHVISRRWLDENGCEKYRKGKMHKPLFSSLRMQICYLLVAVLFLKRPEIFPAYFGWHNSFYIFATRRFLTIKLRNPLGLSYTKSNFFLKSLNLDGSTFQWKQERNAKRNSIFRFYRPFYSFLLSCLAFEWKWGWRWPCFDRNLPAFLMLMMLFSCLLVGICIWKAVRFLTKQGQLQPHFHSKARQLSTQL